MFRSIFCLALVLTVVSAGQFVIQTCKVGQEGESTNVKMSSPQFPDGTLKPILKKGVTYDLVIEFVGTKASANLTTVIFGEINGIQLPFPGVNENACSDLSQGRCPLANGVAYVYNQSLTVESTYPAVSLNIIWTLVSADGKNQVCIKLPAQITN